MILGFAFLKVLALFVVAAVIGSCFAKCLNPNEFPVKPEGWSKYLCAVDNIELFSHSDCGLCGMGIYQRCGIYLCARERLRDLSV